MSGDQIMGAVMIIAVVVAVALGIFATLRRP